MCTPNIKIYTLWDQQVLCKYSMGMDNNYHYVCDQRYQYRL